MSLVRVWTDIGTGKNVSLVARIIESDGTNFTIQFLSPTEDKDKHGCTIYKYEDDTYVIDDDSITHYLNTEDETEIGFKQVNTGEWIRTDEESDDDYVPSEEEDDTETEEEDEEEDVDIEDDEDIEDEADDYDDEEDI
jgi:hypothetical protein